MSVDNDSGDYDLPEPPPVPPNCSPELKYQVEYQAWSTRATVGQLRANQRAHKSNHKELLTAIQKVDEKVDESAKPSLLNRLTIGLASNPKVQQALITLLVSIVGAFGAYMGFKLTNIPVTPSPVQVVVEEALPPQ